MVLERSHGIKVQHIQREYQDFMEVRAKPGLVILSFAVSHILLYGAPHYPVNVYIIFYGAPHYLSQCPTLSSRCLTLSFTMSHIISEFSLERDQDKVGGLYSVSTKGVLFLN